MSKYLVVTHQTALSPDLQRRVRTLVAEDPAAEFAVLVPEAMGPMEERQGDQDEEVESRHQMRQEAMEELVAGRLEPSQGKGQTRQEEMDGEEERGDRPAGAEQQPQERRDPFHHLPAQQHEGHSP